MAIQIFYQNDFFDGKKDLAQIQEDVVENYLLDNEEDISDYRKKIDKTFLNNLISGLSINITQNDEKISEFLTKTYNLENIDKVMLQIFRLAAFELNFMHNVPPKVVIDEYVDISASFFEEKKVKFVNALLDNLAKKLR